MDKYAAIMAAAHGGAYGHNNTAIPTMAQAVAGNYRMGRCRINGIAIAIEQPQGSYREGTDPDGKQWRTRLAAHYGYLPGTKGADNDPLDCFIGPWPESDLVWVINQVDPSSQRFDEHKIMLCFQTEEAARTAYLQSYDRDWRGLGSMVQATTEQLKWWLKFGNHKAALTAKALPFDGNDNMSQTVWDSAGNPVGNDLAGIIYNLRRDDAGGLLLDAVSVADILEDADAVLALDALVVPYNKLQRKMEQLQAVMNIAGDAVKPLAMQLTQPFKQRGTTNVAAIFELSDGQTVSVYFHNPDTTPNKLTPDDEMVSWRWLLNKKDVTIVVAPEKGTDLNVREVARRIMRLADKNSAKFQAANTTRASRLQAIEGMKQEIESKTAELNALEDEIAALTEAKAAAPATSPVATLLWSEGSRDENRDFASLDDLEEWFKQTYPESQLKNGTYSKNKIRLMLPGQPVGEHRIDVANNAGDFNPHRESLVSYLKEMGVNVPEAATATKPAPAAGGGDVAAGSDAEKLAATVRASGFRATVANGRVWLARDDGSILYYANAKQADSAVQKLRLAGFDAGVPANASPAKPVLVRGLVPILLDTDAEIRALGMAEIESIGSENVYVIKDGKEYYFKPVDTGQFKVGPFDFSGVTVFGGADAGEAAKVDEAYKFASATDEFKEWLSDTVEKADYSPFVTAKGMDQEAKRLGASIQWAFVDGDPEHVGLVSAGGRIVGRIDMGGDGKALIFTGDSGKNRVKYRSAVDGEIAEYGYSDDDAVRMVTDLLTLPENGVAPSTETLTDFESGGGQPWQVTQAKWLSLWEAENKKLGQDGSPGEYAEYHKNQVQEALNRGESVPADVLADYPGMTAVSEAEKQAQYAEAENRLRGLTGAMGGTTASDVNHKQIAATILNQLGGGQFRAMTGAKDFMALSNTPFGGLQFRLPSNFAKTPKGESVNRVIIKVNAADTYDVEYGWARGMTYKIKATSKGVYDYMLPGDFKENTGLDVSLNLAPAPKGDIGADARDNAKELIARGGFDANVGGAYIRLEERGPITVDEQRDIRLFFSGSDGMAKLASVVPAHGHKSISDIMDVLLAMFRTKSDKPVPDGPSAQFERYRDWIASGKEVTQGMREQIKADERLNNGEAEQLLAMVQPVAESESAPITDLSAATDKEIDDRLAYLNSKGIKDITPAETDEAIDLTEEHWRRRRGNSSADAAAADGWFSTEQKAVASLAAIGYKPSGDGRYTKPGKPDARIEPGSTGQGGYWVRATQFSGEIEGMIMALAKASEKTEKEVRRAYEGAISRSGKEEADRLLASTLAAHSDGSPEPTAAAEAATVEEQAQQAANTGDDADKAAAVAFMQSVIDGTADYFAEDLADRLTEIHDKWQGSEEMIDLFNKAVDAYERNMVEAAKAAMG